MARIIRILIVALVLHSLSLYVVTAHINPYDSVNGGQLGIRDFTDYDTERMHAISQWNALSPVWVYDWYSGQPIDLIMEDYYDSADSKNAVYVHQAGTDLIRFNEYQMDNNTHDEQLKTATHEVGHALGLDDSFYQQVMYGGTDDTHDLQIHDLCDYNIKWNGYSYCSCHSSCLTGGGS